MPQFLCACLLWILCCHHPARSVDLARPIGYPEKPVEIIVPFSPGGGMDVCMRLLARHAEEEIGQLIQVRNLTSGGNIGGNIAGINAPPDGSVWCAWGNGLVTDQLIVKNAGYTYKDVLPVAMVAMDPHVIAIGAEFAQRSGVSDLNELFRYMRAHPGHVVFGAGGNWTTHDFLRIKLETAANAKFARMPFLGGGPAAQAASEGNCDVVTPVLSEYMEYLDNDGLIPLAIAYPKRADQLPDVPTTAEEGRPEILQSMWRVVTLPKDTPRFIASYVETVLRRTVNDRDFRIDAAKAGITPVFMGSQGLADFLDEQYAFYDRVTTEWNIKVRR